MNRAIFAYLRSVPKCSNKRISLNKTLLDTEFAKDKPGLQEAIVALYESDCRKFIEQKGKCYCEINSVPKCTCVELPYIKLIIDDYVYEYNPFSVYAFKKSN